MFRYAMIRVAMTCSLALTLSWCSCYVTAQDTAQKTESPKKNSGSTIAAASGKLQLTLPESWKAGPKGSRILEFEFYAPADVEDKASRARITMMRAGGSVEANIDRWIGQFIQPDGSPTDKVAKVEKFEADGQTVHLVNITGNYEESMGGGPFAPGRKVLREDYQMLGAIVVSDDVGQYFIKMTGPRKVVGTLTEGFKAMLKTLSVK